MELKELRIGNLIFECGIDYDSGGNMFNDPLGDEVITFEYEDLINIKNRPEFYKPIPLTEEWLVRFGFEKDGDGDFCLADFCFRWQFGTLTLLLDIGHIKPPLEYVHQLQNLYFALTGNELTVT